MNLLAIDTSTDRASVALSFYGKIYSDFQDNIRQHAQLILPTIDKLAIEAGCSIQDLDGIVFGRGPGSFTGIRIACSVAKGLAYAHNLPVYPVSSLQAIASDVFLDENDYSAQVLSIIDARMSEVYCCYYEHDLTGSNEMVCAAKDVDVALEDPIILAGFGFEEYLSDLSLKIRSRIIKTCKIYPNAEAMIRLVQQGYSTAVTADDALPVYVRNQVTHGGVSG